jgi:hypothetical protein
VNAGEGLQYMFHGSFSQKKDAKEKEKKVKGSWIKGTLTNAGYRYLVLSERKNPIKQHRRRNLSSVTFDPAVGKYLATAFSKQYGNVYAHGYTKKQAATNLRDRLRALRRGDIDPHTWQASGAGYYAGNPGQNPGLPTLRAGMSAVLDSSSGLIPVKVLSISGNSAQVQIKRDGGGYRKGETVSASTSRVVPRAAVRRRKYGTGIGRYDIAPNPHELMVMGANPGHDREITLPPGATIVIRTPRQNPSAEAIRESFTGAPVDGEMITDEPHMPAGSYAQLGEVLALHVKPHSGGQVQAIEFSRPRPLLVSDESARQIYFVGGDQNLDDSLMAFNPRHRGGGIYELGQGRRIDYKQRKAHVRNPDADEWRHDLGEETGERPLVLYDTNCRRILLEGGAYVIRPEGIVN